MVAKVRYLSNWRIAVLLSVVSVSVMQHSVRYRDGHPMVNDRSILEK